MWHSNDPEPQAVVREGGRGRLYFPGRGINVFINFNLGDKISLIFVTFLKLDGLLYTCSLCVLMTAEIKVNFQNKGTKVY